jgi:N-acetylglutamate synthase
MGMNDTRAAHRGRDVPDTDDLGHRVVVRRFVRIDPTGRPQFTDLLGQLITLGDDRLVLRADDGIEHTVALVDVVAAKRVPPRPARYSEIVAIERIADVCWPAPVHERLGEWYLRAAEGWTNRANSALPLGDPGLPLDAAIDACARWYRQRALTPRVTVPLPLRRDVARALTVRGWHAQPVVLVQAAPLAALGDPATATGVLLREGPSADFLELVAARKEGLPASAHHVLRAVAQVRFAEVRDEDGALLAGARGAVSDGWLHLGLVEVVPEARRQGLGRRVSQALATWAAQSGATRAFVQVEDENTAAVGLYASMGFTTHHRYVTYRSPSGTAE